MKQRNVEQLFILSRCNDNFSFLTYEMVMWEYHCFTVDVCHCSQVGINILDDPAFSQPFGEGKLTVRVWTRLLTSSQPYCICEP